MAILLFIKSSTRLNSNKNSKNKEVNVDPGQSAGRSNSQGTLANLTPIKMY
jgi:hypothetical protein